MLFTLDKHKARLYVGRDMLCCIIELETLSPMIGGMDNVTIHQLAFIDKVLTCVLEIPWMCIGIKNIWQM